MIIRSKPWCDFAVDAAQAAAGLCPSSPFVSTQVNLEQIYERSPQQGEASSESHLVLQEARGKGRGWAPACEGISDPLASQQLTNGRNGCVGRGFKADKFHGSQITHSGDNSHCRRHKRRGVGERSTHSCFRISNCSLP